MVEVTTSMEGNYGNDLDIRLLGCAERCFGV
jgi:hypothetical protein